MHRHRCKDGNGIALDADLCEADSRNPLALGWSSVLLLSLNSLMAEMFATWAVMKRAWAVVETEYNIGSVAVI